MSMLYIIIYQIQSRLDSVKSQVLWIRFWLLTLFLISIVEMAKSQLCYVDLKKAYDSVWRPAMLLKLLNMNITGAFYYQIKATYEETLVCIKEGSRQYHLHFVAHLVSGKGDVLSPLLFKLYINDCQGLSSLSKHWVGDNNKSPFLHTIRLPNTLQAPFRFSEV